MSRILPRFDFRVDIAAESVIGKVREKNEDALLVAPDHALFGVADGMGGLSSGELASRLALEIVKEYISAKPATRTLEEYVKAPTLENRRRVFDLLRDAVGAAHARLVEEQETRGEPMGTTLDVCLFVREKAFVAHVGDGRVFLARSRATLQVTEDHLVHDPASARRPDDGKRTKTPRPLASGVGLPVPLRVDVFPIDVRRGDTLVLASDGAYGPFETEAAITAACKGPPRAIAEEMVRYSLAKGGRDNASVVAIRVEDRFIARQEESPDRGLDAAALAQSPLFEGLPMSSLLGALACGIEVEVEAGHDVPAFDAGDLCAYLVLDGLVSLPDGTSLGPPALLYPESLVGVDKPKRVLARAAERLRGVRVRHDDFREVCQHDHALAGALYKRLATHLARLTPPA
jgi:serine/threonine protein phosphatase PrpC